MPFGEVDINSASSGNEKGSTADVDAQDEIVVLDGAICLKYLCMKFISWLFKTQFLRENLILVVLGKIL